MTFPELRIELGKLKKVSDVYCNLFDEYHRTSENIGLYVVKISDKWEVHFTERGGKDLVCIFNTDHDVCEYVYCYFKKASDNNRWF